MTSSCKWSNAFSFTLKVAFFLIPAKSFILFDLENYEGERTTESFGHDKIYKHTY